ncbi:gluconate operon transcriptional repressor GntR [Maribrevibacterium harenarium]|uniref:Gluconate operon transcriptional repressor GntR n=1 Tax=Maribrevibacterium harenarium TaxID=2589817 RepID=A0A501WVX0_9GAMM|nr:gluconate operon transcriptional repressor GntR [Maribrevibacterium harenarium]TPE53419.1 gluconate operon transcriptional repressor GntR [Maribrevibacterium harenarium]
MKKKRTTLQDIADRVGVTKMTVSRFMRNPEQVSDTLRHQIQAALDELGYIPNRAPDILSKAKSHAIGVLLPSLTNQVFAEVIRGIESVLEPAGYQTMLAHYGYSKTSEEQRIATLLSYNVDALIISESQHTERAQKMLENAGIPVVEIMDSVAHSRLPAVGFDNRAAAFEMTQAMIARGHQKIAYFAARMDERTLQRIQGYEAAMAEAGLSPYIKKSDQASSFTLGAQFLEQLLEEFPQADGIFCTNDDLAIGALYACQKRGILIPEQMGIAGFHGHDVARAMVPRLATVITPREDMGRIAAEQLLLALNGEATHTTPIALPYQIDCGESLRC